MTQRNIEVPTPKGRIFIPASNYCEKTPNLAVTMCSFGTFEVTHAVSGYRLIGGFERAVNAFVAMFELQLAFNELNINSDVDDVDLKLEIQSKDKQCESLGGITILEWIGINTTIGNICSEFPWENDEEGPHARLELLMKKLGVETNG